MYSKNFLILFITIILTLLIVMPSTFAFNNTTSVNNDVLSVTDYYFDKNNTDAGTGTLENPFNELNNSNLKDNSIIHLANGEYDLQSSKSFRDISFYGENSQNTILNCHGFTLSNNGILNFRNITLVNLTISNSGTLNAYNSIFKNSQSDYGGVINSNSNKNVYLTNCEFYNNSAKYGGVIYISNGLLECNNTIFENNSASVFGGVITSIQSNLRLKNIKAINNKAIYEGGVIYSLFGNFLINNSLLSNNIANNGGALFIDNNTNALFINNTFSNNYANITAGAIYSLANLNTTFENNSYINNTALTFNDLLNTSTPSLFIGSGDYMMFVFNSDFTGDIPDYYNLAEHGYVTSIKDQGSGGNCWAFAATAALESCILKAGGQIYDLSEENMKNLMAKYSDYGWKQETNRGGYHKMAVGYFTSWFGAVNESDDEYSYTSILSPVINSFIHIQNVIFLPRNNYTDNDAIKKAILEYGGVATSIKWLGSSVKENTRYYSGTDKADHAVLIVGWDDNYSKENFANEPPGDGAWIVKNSHGINSGNQGYWYISYYDTRCAQINKSDVSYTFILNDTLRYDKNYQYDIPGETDFFINSSSTVWYKNIFTATNYENLTAVSTYFNNYTNYTIYIIVNDELKLTQSGYSEIGYYTFNLNESIPLEIGDVFQVIFKITVDGEAGVPISEHVSLNKLLYNQNMSFISYDGNNWLDLFNLTWNYSTHKYNSQVACIKAFTVFDRFQLIFNEKTKGKVHAIILNELGYPVNDGEVTFSYDNRNYTIDVVNGTAIFPLCFNLGVYNVSAVYTCRDYVSSKISLLVNITEKIKTSVSLNILNMYNPINISAFVVDQFGDALLEGNVTFILDGVNYTVDVVNGTAFIVHNFKNVGINSISAYYNGFLIYNYSQTSTNINIESSIISKDSTNVLNSIYSVKLLDSTGNPLINQDIDLKIGFKVYNIKTDNFGIASLNIKLNVGTYSVKIVNPINNETKTQTIKVIPTITENKAITMYYGAGNMYKVRVRDINGNFAGNLKVTFNINNKNYYAFTDKNGYASFKINLNPNNYIITANYNGFKVSNKIIVKSTIITKDIKVKKSKTIKFTAKLVNSKGKILKSKKITFKFKGKTYKIKTNKKGVAILKITKKYKKGRYTITSSYGKLTIKNTINIVK